MRKLFLVVSFLIILPVLVAAQNVVKSENKITGVNSKQFRLESELKSIYERFLQAITKRDIEAYQKLITDKYTFTRGNTGEVLDKEHRIAQLKQESKYAEVYNILSVKFSAYKLFSIGNFDIEEKDIYQGNSFNSLLRTTVIFVKVKHHGWQIAAVHSSPMPK